MKADDLTDDGFLDNRLKVLQPRKGYRAGLDAVMVAAAVPAKPGDHVFEAGIGTGVAALCLARRVPGILITGIEINPDYAALAEENAARNSFKDSITISTGDMTRLSDTQIFALGSFDHAFANPPYREVGKFRKPEDAGRRVAYVIDIGGIQTWMNNLVNLVGDGGTVTMILPSELDEAICQLSIVRENLLKIVPLLPREGEYPLRRIYQLVKGESASIKTMPGLVLHDEATNYTEKAESILRMGEALQFED